MPRQRFITARRWAWRWTHEFILTMRGRMISARRYDLLRQFRRVERQLFNQLHDAVTDMAMDGAWVPDLGEQLYDDLVDSQIDMLAGDQGLGPATPEISE